MIRLKTKHVTHAMAAMVVGGVFATVAMASTGRTSAHSARLNAMTAISNVPYATNSPKEILDIYESPVSNSPLVVLVHGGGWTLYDKSNYAAEANALLSAGFTVFNIDYRLDSPTVAAFAMEVNDVELATQWAINNAIRYNANPANVTLLGGSAGGQLVGMAAEQLNTAHSGTVRKVVTLSGPTDFVSLVQDDIAGRITQPSFAQHIPQALGCSLASCTVATETQWSPARNVTPSICPMGGWLIFNSQRELVPLDQPSAMTAALQQNKCQVTEDLLPGSAHSITYWSAVEPTIVSFIQH